MAGYDPARVAAAITAATTGASGITLVVNVFASLPGVVHTPGRRSMFRSEPERIQIGDWRYAPTGDGRLRAAHVVGGIVVADEEIHAGAVGAHIARALGQVVARFGDGVLPNIDAALEVLAASA